MQIIKGAVYRLNTISAALLMGAEVCLISTLRLTNGGGESHRWTKILYFRRFLRCPDTSIFSNSWAPYAQHTRADSIFQKTLAVAMNTWLQLRWPCCVPGSTGRIGSRCGCVAPEFILSLDLLRTRLTIHGHV